MTLLLPIQSCLLYNRFLWLMSSILHAVLKVPASSCRRMLLSLSLCLCTQSTLTE